MKKRLILGMAALAAITLTSCQKDQVINQVPQEQAIEFGTYLGRDAQTKAGIMNLSGLQASEVGFGVYAYYTKEADYSNNNTSGSPLNFMNDQHVKYNNPSWGYSPIKYWPASTTDKFTFFAYGPKNSANIFDRPGNSLKGDPTFGFTVNETISAQTDLLFADNNHTNITKPENKTVKFNFKHALSRIGFKASTSINDNNTTVTITSITLNGNFHSNGILNLNGGDWDVTSAGTIAQFTLNSQDLHHTVINNTETDLNKNTGQADKGYIMIIPQEFTDSNTDYFTITVNYTVKTQDGSLNGGYSETISNSVTSAPMSLKFEQGVAYTFKLTVGIDAIIFDAEVTDWSEYTPAVNVTI